MTCWFLICTDEVVYTYLVTDLWNGTINPYPAIAYNDPELNIPWRPIEPIVSEKDRANPPLREAYPEECARWIE